MKRAILFFLISIAFLGCGDSKIEVQNTLLVVDTYPSNGAEIESTLDKIIVFFSSSLEESAIKNESFVLELVGEVDVDISGVPVKTQILGLSEYKSAVIVGIDAPLTVGSIYRLTISDVKSATSTLLSQKYYKFFIVKSK
jgi:hypothetical protein